MVFAFGQGGAAAVGIISLVQLIPAGIIAPLGSVLGDRFPREKVFMLAEASMSVACVLAAVAALLDAPAIVIYAAACSVGWLLTLVRPKHGALLPWLARDPTELTTAYTAAGLIESSCVLLSAMPLKQWRVPSTLNCGCCLTNARTSSTERARASRVVL